MLIVTSAESLAFRGLAALAFGLFTLFWPGLTLTALVVLFGVFVLLDGLAMFAALIGSNPIARRHPWWYVLHGLASCTVGILALAWPGITTLALLYLIAAWALISGAIRVAAAVRERDEMPHWGLAAVAGVASIVFGVLLVLFPGAGALAITWLIGWYAVVAGAILVWQAWRLRREPQTEPVPFAARSGS